MRVLDLFSGIGGFSLAARWAQMETVAFCEIEPFCQKVLQKNFPGVPIYSDVRQLTRKQLERDGVIDDTRGIDLMCGGIPCQPFSVAGKQRGQDDERHLWPEMFRLVRELRPSWVVVENVTGFIKLALDDVLDDLESEGYATQSVVIPAQAIGAPHKRERLWIVAYTSSKRWNNGGDHREERHLQNNEEWNTTESQPEGNERISRISKNSETLANTNRRTTQRRLDGYIDGVSFRMDRPKHRWPAPFGCEQYDYEPPRTIRGQKHRKDRIKALGNAIVPQVAFEIFRAIRIIENQ